MMVISAISGSLRRDSFNSALLRAMAELAPDGVTFRLVDNIDRLPFFNPDIDDIENPHEAVGGLRKALRESDCLILCSPEYAHNISGVMKNALEWVVGSGELVNKPVVVVNVSTSFMGGDKAHASLKYLVRLLSANLIEEVSFHVASAVHKFDKSGKLTDPEIKNKIKKVFEYFQNNLV